MNRIGKRRSVNGGEPPSHAALMVLHWDGVNEKRKVNPDEGGTARERRRKRRAGSKLSFCGGKRRRS
jgi:hypothetical protein